MEEEDPKHEQSILCPTNPYAATKAGDNHRQSYHHSFKFHYLYEGCNVMDQIKIQKRLFLNFWN